jgi:hypothetical protein
LIILGLNKYDKYNQIGINWLLFGSNFLYKEPNTTMLESYTKSDTKINKHIKSIARPNKITKGTPHHYYPVNDLCVGINFKPFNISDSSFIYLNDMDYNYMNAYVAHHMFQSFETYKKRKVSRKRDDTNVAWNWNLNNMSIHTLYNDTDNFLPRNKYNEDNKKLMNLITED